MFLVELERHDPKGIRRYSTPQKVNQHVIPTMGPMGYTRIDGDSVSSAALASHTTCAKHDPSGLGARILSPDCERGDCVGQHSARILCPVAGLW